MLGPIKNLMGYVINNLYFLTGSYVLAIVLLTIIVKTLLLPLTISQLKSQAAMSELQPKIKELQKKYKNDKETLNIKTMELYKEHNANPLAGCLPLLIQVPIIFALFGVMKEPGVYVFQNLADKGAEIVGKGFLWVPNLAQPDLLSNIVQNDMAGMFPGLFPLMAAVLTYLQFKIAPAQSMDSGEKAQDMMKSMLTVMPLMIYVFGRSMSAALVIYWVVSSIYQIAQQVIIKKLKDRRKMS